MRLPLVLAGKASSDIYAVNAVFTLAYGGITLRNPAGWTGKQVYDFLDALDPGFGLPIVSGLILLVGLTQLAGAVVDRPWLRAAGSGLAIIHWMAFAWGGLHHDPNAYVSWMYLCAGIGAAVALCRV